jgi:ribosomal protein L21E
VEKRKKTVDKLEQIMYNFKVGDRVVLKENNTGYKITMPGDSGTVEIMDGRIEEIYVKFDQHPKHANLDVNPKDLVPEKIYNSKLFKVLK